MFFLGIRQVESGNSVLKRLQNLEGLRKTQCIGIIVGRGVSNFLNSSMACLGEAVNPPKMGIANTSSFAFAKPSNCTASPTCPKVKSSVRTMTPRFILFL